MRIVMSNASPLWGGVHRITELLAAGLERRGHEVLILCRPDSLLEERLRGRFTTASVVRGMDFSPVAISRIAATLRRFRPDVVLTLLNKDLRLSAPAAYMLGIPVVARHANDRPVRSGFIGRLVHGRIVSRHVANSEATRRTKLASLPWLDPSRVAVIYNGIDVDAIADAAPADLPVPDDAVVVGFIARLEERKGVHDLLDAWPAVTRAQPRAHLVVVGRGVLEDTVRTRAATLDRVHVAGYSTNVAGVVRRCDIVAMPSHWEGFGLVAAEAMAAGTPVVAADASSLPEIVRDGVDGVLVPPRDPASLAAALIRLIADRDLRQQLGSNGQKRAAEQFSHERMVDQFEIELQRVAR